MPRRPPKRRMLLAEADKRTQSVFDRVRRERRAQDQRFGDHAGLTNTDAGERDFFRAFHEELGEHCRARLDGESPQHQMHELIQAIAVLVAWAETLETPSGDDG